MAVHGAHVTVISGQKNSGEIVLSAAAFLCGNYRSTTLVSTNKNIRQDLYLSLDVCTTRECFARNPTTYYAKIQQKDIIYPSEYTLSRGGFWLALDEQGFSIAKEIFSTVGLKYDEQFKQSVYRLNLVRPTISNFPEINVPSDFWKNIMHELAEAHWAHRRIKSKKNVRALYDRLVPMMPAEKELCYWYKSLHDALIPWIEVMDSMTSYL